MNNPLQVPEPAMLIKWKDQNNELQHSVTALIPEEERPNFFAQRNILASQVISCETVNATWDEEDKLWKYPVIEHISLNWPNHQH